MAGFLSKRKQYKSKDTKLYWFKKDLNTNNTSHINEKDLSE